MGLNMVRTLLNTSINIPIFIEFERLSALAYWIFLWNLHILCQNLNVYCVARDMYTVCVWYDLKVFYCMGIMCIVTVAKSNLLGFR